MTARIPPEYRPTVYRRRPRWPTVRPIFRWYDLWVGLYWNREARRLYVLPLPMCGVVVQFRPPPWVAREDG